MGVNNQKSPWNYKGQEHLLQILWEPRPDILSFTLQIRTTLPALTFPFSCPTASFSYFPSFSPWNPQVTKSPSLPNEGIQLN